LSFSSFIRKPEKKIILKILLILSKINKMSDLSGYGGSNFASILMLLTLLNAFVYIVGGSDGLGFKESSAYSFFLIGFDKNA